jgi:hypothetical protein
MRSYKRIEGARGASTNAGALTLSNNENEDVQFCRKEDPLVSGASMLGEENTMCWERKGKEFYTDVSATCAGKRC